MLKGEVYTGDFVNGGQAAEDCANSPQTLGCGGIGGMGGYADFAPGMNGTDGPNGTAGSSTNVDLYESTFTPVSISPQTFPVGTVGTPYSAAVGIQGGVGPFTWQLDGGTFPPGLSLNATTGEITGTPTTAGTFNFTAEVTDQGDPAGSPATAQLTITINPSGPPGPLTITTTSLNSGTVGTAYSASVSATGGTTPYTWSTTTGALPGGLTLNASTGAITGTPTTAGTFDFTVEVTDSEATPATAQKALSITISPAQLTITTTSLNSGTVGTAYSASVSATGGTTPYTWSTTTGALPGGLTLNASTGAITGTPTTAGTFDFTVEVTDSEATPATAQKALSITISPAQLTITTTSLNSGTVGTAYSASVSATGGTTPYTWSTTTGALPGGLTLNASTGAITGTPTTAGTFDFTVEVTDSEATPATAQKALSITISPATLAITTTSLTGGTVGTAYSASVSATGGTTPYTWSTTTGALPGGLTLNASTGAITGTPTTAGTFDFTVEVTDSETTPATAQKALSITISPATLAITTTSLTGGTVGTAYSATVSATGGTTPYTWSTTTGALPGGLTLNASTGAITGTPTTAGTFDFTVEVTDSETTPATAQKALSITISPAQSGTTSPTAQEFEGGGNGSEPDVCICNTGLLPVEAESGDFWHTFDDLAIPGRGFELGFSRTYNSLAASVDGPLGFGWTDPYAMTLSENSVTQDVTINQENGSTVTFLPTATGYAAAPRVVATLTHNASGTWTFVRASTATYVFSASGQLLSESDLDGDTTTLAYNASGELTKVTDPEGRTLTFTYTSAGQIAGLTDPDGRTMSFAYDSAGDLSSVTEVDGGVWHYTYDSSHHLATMTDPKGEVTTNTYNASGQVLDQTDPTGRTTTYSYSGDPFSAAGGTTTVTAPGGQVGTETSCLRATDLRNRRSRHAGGPDMVVPIRPEHLGRDQGHRP